MHTHTRISFCPLTSLPHTPINICTCTRSSPAQARTKIHAPTTSCLSSPWLQSIWSMKNANHMKTIDPRLSSSAYTLYGKKAAVDDGGEVSSHVNLIDYLKGRGDLVNTQALLNNTCTHAHTHTSRSMPDCLKFFYPTFHQSEIFSKSVSSWINIC